jgi:hypothetical protein
MLSLHTFIMNVLSRLLKLPLRAILPLRIAIGLSFYSPLDEQPHRVQRNVFRVDRYTVAKRSHAKIVEKEVQSMRFVAKQTSIPVPHVFDSWTDGDIGWITMSYIPGVTIGEAWPNMSPGQQERFIS